MHHLEPLCGLVTSCYDFKCCKSVYNKSAVLGLQLERRVETTWSGLIIT